MRTRGGKGSEVVDVVEDVRIEGGVVVGHDGSQCAQEALRWAAGLARRADLDLHVVRAWAMTTAPQPSTWVAGYVPPIADYEKAVLDELGHHVAAARLDPAVRVTCHAVHKPPVPSLIAAGERATCWSSVRAAVGASPACSWARSATSWCTTRR